MNEPKKKLTLTVATIQTLETKATPTYEYSSADPAKHRSTQCPRLGQVAAVAYY